MQNESELKMNVIPIEVPEDIEYISQWTSFVYPLQHLILDKTICGCGFTEYCLNNNIPTVLCSPRKKLLENKEEQHNSEEGRENGFREIYYFRNDYENNIEFDDNKGEEDKSVSTPFGDIKLEAIQIQENKDEESKDKRKQYLSMIKNQLRSYIESCSPSQGNPFKIIVTYDSLHHVLDVLNEYYSSSSYAIVVDEFQSIFMDSAFKSEVELDFVEDLKGCANVLYLSATPMLEKYLVQLDYFKDLPMYKFKWSDKRIERVRIQRETVRNINKRVGEIITDYREGRYPNKILSDGTLKESKELVIFVNSIKSICDIIKKCNLTPEETNIICADTSTNIKKLKTVKHTIGKVPTQGQPHKMFTLCTRTTYLGADFYSTSAFTVICSDCNIKTLIVDISLDLPQIIGRQRLKENVFRNEVLILYKAETKKAAIINESRLVNDERRLNKKEKTDKLLKEYNKMSDEGKELWAEKAERDNKLYQNDYLGVSSKTGKVMFNYLVMVADQRAFDVSRKEYQDDVTIKRGIESLTSINAIEEINQELNDLRDVYNSFIAEFEKDNNFERRMRLIYDVNVEYPQLFVQYSQLLSIKLPMNIQNYINLLGLNKIRALKYRESDILDYISNMNKVQTNSIVSLFQVGFKYSTQRIKEMLREFYEENNITKTPKASDLEEYYNLKPCQFVDKALDKKVNGFLILSLKGDV